MTQKALPHMTLQEPLSQNDLLRQIDNRQLSLTEKALLRCQLAKLLEEAGNYEAAQGALGDLWRGLGERPYTDGLEDTAAAEVLLRAGSLIGWIGSARQAEGAQEIAKNLITESETIFTGLNKTDKVAEAHTDLAYCYWREGAYDEARIIIQEALAQLENSQGEQKAVALIRSGIVELSANKHWDAYRIFSEAAPFILTFTNHALRGKFHMNFGIVLRNLNANYNNDEFRDRALIEYAAASFHLDKAGHIRYRARVENNLGFLFWKAGNFKEAHEHLNRARRLFNSLRDTGSIAQVDDSRARALLAEGRPREAEKIAISAVNVLEKGDEQAELARALTTYGIALARNDQYYKAQTTLQRAAQIADQIGDKESAGLAHLSLIEELGERLSRDDLLGTFDAAYSNLHHSQNPENLPRLLSCAWRVLSVEKRLSSFKASDFIFNAGEIAVLLRVARRVAETNSTILLTGETGTGKEVLAGLIHKWSNRSGEYVAINCAALTDGLLESELFGHRRGSFTGAVSDAPGLVLHATGGTLFLDEVGELSAGNQSKLLRLIDNKEIQPVGAAQPQHVDVRIIAATNRNLAALVKAGSFRSDLLYRLQTFEIIIPPLRARPNDIPAIAEHFIKEICHRHGKQVAFTPEALEALKNLKLRGNARELRTLVERTVLMVESGARITKETVETFALRQTSSDHVGKGHLANGWSGCLLDEEVLRYEGELILRALEEAKGSVTHAARFLGMSHQRLSSILQGRHKNLLNVRKPVINRLKSYTTAKEKAAKKAPGN
jgi:DNA-binding NtrC family response regulator/Flp pilus assembly protein TadD